MRKAHLALALVLALTAGLPSVQRASARDHRDHRDHEAARAALARGEILPLTKILAVVAQQNPGDVLEVQLERDDERFVYEVKVLSRAGRVTRVKVDGKTGSLLDDQEDQNARSDRRR